MGNYPYASSYLLHGHGMLPPWPVRAACAPLSAALTGDALLNAMRDAVGVYYNYTHAEPCFFNGPTALPGTRPRLAPRRARVADSGRVTSCRGDWDYQWCTEMAMPFARPDDGLFWPAQPYDPAASAAGCLAAWGVAPRPLWAAAALAPRALPATLNAVFSNGLLDPWHPGGVLVNVSGTATALVMADGAHHLDLMFSDPADPPDVRAVRAEEVRRMREWTGL